MKLIKKSFSNYCLQMGDDGRNLKFQTHLKENCFGTLWSIFLANDTFRFYCFEVEFSLRT